LAGTLEALFSIPAGIYSDSGGLWDEARMFTANCSSWAAEEMGVLASQEIISIPKRRADRTTFGMSSPLN